jgi:transitional endoplasmic reticulum ATPase
LINLDSYDTMSQKDSTSLSLEVCEEYTGDVGECIARIDSSSMKLFKILDGEVIEISGKRKTVARCLSLNPLDEGKKIICIDGFIRNNVGVNTGDIVTVKKVKSVPAKKIVVQPVGSIPTVTFAYLGEMLENKPMIKGDFVVIPYFGGKLTFQVSETIPEAYAVLVDEKTEFDISK